MGHRGLHSEHPLILSPPRASPSVPAPHPWFFKSRKFQGIKRGWVLFLFCFLTQQSCRVLYFTMNIVVVQKIHFARWLMATMCVCTLGDLNVAPAPWLQCSVVERLNHTALGSPLRLFLAYSRPLTSSRGCCVWTHWVGFSVHGGGRFVGRRTQKRDVACLSDLNHDGPYLTSNSP